MEDVKNGLHERWKKNGIPKYAKYICKVLSSSHVHTHKRKQNNSSKTIFWSQKLTLSSLVNYI